YGYRSGLNGRGQPAISHLPWRIHPPRWRTPFSHKRYRKAPPAHSRYVNGPVPDLPVRLPCVPSSAITTDITVYPLYTVYVYNLISMVRPQKYLTFTNS